MCRPVVAFRIIWMMLQLLKKSTSSSFDSNLYLQKFLPCKECNVFEWLELPTCMTARYPKWVPGGVRALMKSLYVPAHCYRIGWFHCVSSPRNNNDHHPMNLSYQFHHSGTRQLNEFVSVRFYYMCTCICAMSPLHMTPLHCVVIAEFCLCTDHWPDYLPWADVKFGIS